MTTAIMTKDQIVIDKNLILNDYIPAPFWAMNPMTWQKYITQLDRDNQHVLRYYPFKWAYVHPNSAGEAVNFLQEIGVDEGEVSKDSIESHLNRSSGEVLWTGRNRWVMTYPLPASG